MNTLTRFFVPAIILGAALPASAQVIGYYNLQLSPGDNLIANQLDAYQQGAGVPNTLNYVLSDALPGSTFTEQDPTTGQLLPLSVFNGTTWSIDYDLAPNGTGGILDSPANTSVTFVGAVNNITFGPGMTPSGYTFVPPTRGPGVYLLGMAAPITGTFDQVVGRAAESGDSVVTLDAMTQTYSTTTFNGTSWNNGTPSFAVGEAEYVELQVDPNAYLQVVPEPSIFVIAGVGALAMFAWRRQHRSA